VASGIAFAFAKATDGVTYTDPKWQTNRTASAKAGIAFGGYHFYEPNDEPARKPQTFWLQWVM
jgi:lysozyme